MPSITTLGSIGLALGAALGAVVGVMWEGGAGFGVGVAVGAGLGVSAGTLVDRRRPGTVNKLEGRCGVASSNSRERVRTTSREPSRCSLCGRLHRPLPGRCWAGLETVACSESGRWLCRDDAESEWRHCEHWAIDSVIKEHDELTPHAGDERSMGWRRLVHTPSTTCLMVIRERLGHADLAVRPGVDRRRAGTGVVGVVAEVGDDQARRVRPICRTGGDREVRLVGADAGSTFAEVVGVGRVGPESAWPAPPTRRTMREASFLQWPGVSGALISIRGFLAPFVLTVAFTVP